METAMSNNHQKKISSFMEIAVGQTKKTAIRFLKATTWDLEEATLYGPSSTNQTQVEVCPEKIWDSESEPSDDSASDGLDLRLSSLYRPPLKLLFKGSFEDAETTSSRKDLWLLVNLQSTTVFASHVLNRDLWSNESVSQAIESSFILLQVYDDTTEGQKISTFYKIESAPPVVLLIDPITGQKMRSWSGEIEAQSFVEDLIKYIDSGPQEHIASLTSNKRIETEKICSESSHITDDQNMSTLWNGDFKETAEHTEHIVAHSWGDEFEELPELWSQKETLYYGDMSYGGPSDSWCFKDSVLRS